MGQHVNTRKSLLFLKSALPASPFMGSGPRRHPTSSPVPWAALPSSAVGSASQAFPALPMLPFSDTLWGFQPKAQLIRKYVKQPRSWERIPL